MLRLTDDDLMALVDGELTTGEAARIEAALAADPAARQRVQALRQLNQQLRSAFAADLGEPVPAALDATARGERPGAARVIPFPLRRPAMTWARWGGLAACLLAGVWLAPRLPGLAPTQEPLLAQADGRMLAGGALAEALDRGLASEAVRQDVRLHLSFKDRDGQYCRTFSAPAGAGLACRSERRWQVVVLAAQAKTPAGEMRLAGSDLPATVLDAVERRISGLALDAGQERLARDGAWSK